eukprot:TRINITY_DN2425_c0_g3_i1.p1 TRINITY_DN2425_c0_g3~~TRINITY_DN2425_c0_g3_i1.p1  ORF type:complete len:218 (-),score=95.74 TRINITY_DN2425_c0_g3_i1:25-678(-)
MSQEKLNKSTSQSDEKTMEEKLKQLEESEKGTEVVEKGKATTTDSLHSLLSQALKKGDNERIAQILNVSQEEVIHKTVERLATESVLVFLKQISHRYEKRPGNTNYVSWLRSILTWHAAYLMTLPGDELQQLHSILSQRVSLFKKLCKLNGKLDLLLSQSGKFNEAPFIEGSSYVENDDDDEEEENEDEDEGEGENDDEEEEEENAMEEDDEEDMSE